MVRVTGYGCEVGLPWFWWRDLSGVSVSAGFIRSMGGALELGREGRGLLSRSGSGRLGGSQGREGPCYALPSGRPPGELFPRNRISPWAVSVNHAVRPVAVDALSSDRHVVHTLDTCWR